MHPQVVVEDKTLIPSVGAAGDNPFQPAGLGIQKFGVPARHFCLFGIHSFGEGGAKLRMDNQDKGPPWRMSEPFDPSLRGLWFPRVVQNVIKPPLGPLQPEPTRTLFKQ